MITIIVGRERSSSTNTLFFFSLLDRSTIIPAILGPKINHVEVELGICSRTYLLCIYEWGKWSLPNLMRY